MIRSSGGDKAVLLGLKREEREKGDARILGSGDFVSETLQQAEVRFEKKYLPKRPIEPGWPLQNPPPVATPKSPTHESEFGHG